MQSTFSVSGQWRDKVITKKDTGTGIENITRENTFTRILGIHALLEDFNNQQLVLT